MRRSPLRLLLFWPFLRIRLRRWDPIRRTRRISPVGHTGNQHQSAGSWSG